MITTNEKKIRDFIWSYMIMKIYDLMQKNINSISYQKIYEGFGTNLRILMQSAIGRIQLRKLKNWRNIRKRNAEIIISRLKKLDIARIEKPQKTLYMHGINLCYLEFKFIKNNWNRDKIIKEITKNGFCLWFCSELYMENCFIEAGLKPEIRLPNSKILGLTSLMFVIHPTISESTMQDYAKSYIILKRASI